MLLNIFKVMILSFGKGFICRGVLKKDVKLLIFLYFGVEFFEKCMFSFRWSVFVELEDYKFLWMLILCFLVKFFYVRVF